MYDVPVRCAENLQHREQRETKVFEVCKLGGVFGQMRTEQGFADERERDENEHNVQHEVADSLGVAMADDLMP